MLTCSHTLSSRSICRHLYMESSSVVYLLVVCQIGSFLVCSFPLLSLSQMYWAEWGPVKFGHTRPDKSNSGLLTITLLAYAFYSQERGLTVRQIDDPQF